MVTAPVDVPIISDELVELFASGVDLCVATRSAALLPESVMGMGIRVHSNRRQVTVHVPTAVCSTTLDNLRDNGQLAVTLCRPLNHCAVQLKGKRTGVRASTESDREVQEIFRAAMVTAFAVVGVPRDMTRRIVWWPSMAIDFEVSSIFIQTPGPDAGEVLTGALK